MRKSQKYHMEQKKKVTEEYTIVPLTRSFKIGKTNQYIKEELKYE